MDGEHIAPVAEVLNARGIPFIFATGYGERALDCAQKASILDKPYTQKRLLMPWRGR